MPSFDMLGLMLFEAADLWLDGCRGPSGVNHRWRSALSMCCILFKAAYLLLDAGELQA
jgi:hypothetical protein